MSEVKRFQWEPIPFEVVSAAQLIRRWVDNSMIGYHDITICGVGLRTFLAVEDMTRHYAREVRIAELKEPRDPLLQERPTDQPSAGPLEKGHE